MNILQVTSIRYWLTGRTELFKTPPRLEQMGLLWWTFLQRKQFHSGRNAEEQSVYLSFFKNARPSFCRPLQPILCSLDCPLDQYFTYQISSIYRRHIHLCRLKGKSSDSTHKFLMHTFSDGYNWILRRNGNEQGPA